MSRVQRDLKASERAAESCSIGPHGPKGHGCLAAQVEDLGAEHLPERTKAPPWGAKEWANALRRQCVGPEALADKKLRETS